MGEDRPRGEPEARGGVTARGARVRHLLYGRRKGPRPSALQQHLWQTLLPGLRLKLEPGADPKLAFALPVEEVWLEAGFGGGEHLIWQAGAHPGVGIVGAEPYAAGIAKLLSRLAAADPATSGTLAPRIRVHEGDVRDVIERLPESSIGRIFILFPDPWPKRRHHKRRLVSTEFLAALARVMKSGAELRFASDDADYVAWALERLTASPDFVWRARCAADWEQRPADWPQTRYEAKALHGPPVYLSFRRR